MSDNTSAVVGFIEIATVFVLPLLGAWIMRHKALDWQQRARARQIRTQIWQGQADQMLLDRVVEDMDRKGQL